MINENKKKKPTVSLITMAVFSTALGTYGAILTSNQFCEEGVYHSDKYIEVSIISMASRNQILK